MLLALDTSPFVERLQYNLVPFSVFTEQAVTSTTGLVKKITSGVYHAMLLAQGTPPFVERKQYYLVQFSAFTEKAVTSTTGMIRNTA